MKSPHQTIQIHLPQLLPSFSKHGIAATRLLFLFLFLFFHALIPLSSAQQQPSPEQPADPYASMRFSPSMAIIIVVLISALFFMGFFSIYIRHCSQSTANGSAVHATAGQNRSRRGTAQRGLAHEVIETFPTFVYAEVKSLKLGKGALECAVCLNEFEDDETLRLIPKCDHVFHPDCIDPWLDSHTTCPVCRTNLVPQPGESAPQSTESEPELDLEAQNDGISTATQQETQVPQPPPEPQVINVTSPKLNRNRTRRSGSYRPRKFPRSHSTGHSLVQPGENTERFTLRLPVDVRKQIMNRQLNRSNSLVVLPREGSSRIGYRSGGEGSTRGKSGRWLDRSFKSDRWVFSMAPPFFTRASSVRSTRVAATDVNSSPGQPGVSSGEPSRPPV